MGEISGSRHYKGGEGRLAPAATKWTCPSCHTENLGVFTQGCQNDRCPSRMTPEPPQTVTMIQHERRTPAGADIQTVVQDPPLKPLLVTDRVMLRTLASALIVYSENVLATNVVEGELSDKHALAFAESILTDCLGDTLEDAAPAPRQFRVHGAGGGVTIDQTFDDMETATRECGKFRVLFPQIDFTCEPVEESAAPAHDE